MQAIKLQSTKILLNYLNSLERVLFIDNRWMKDYEDIKNKVNRKFEGVSLFLKNRLDWFNEEGQNIFFDSLPEKDDRIDVSEMSAVVLESIPFYFGPEEESHLIVVACPDIDRVFHFKSKQMSYHDNILRKVKLSNFSCYPYLPRIKMHSRNLEALDEKEKLSNLKFLYTLLEDIEIEIKSIKCMDNKIIFSNLVPDPSVGVQIGKLAKYYIAPVKLIGFKVFPQNVHQVTLVAEDWKGNKFELNITTEIFRNTFGANPCEEFFDDERYARCLIFQGIGENFKQIICLEESKKEEFLKDSFFAYVRFRKNVKKTEFESVPEPLPTQICENEEHYTYFNHNISLEAYNHYLEFKNSHRLTLPDIMLSLRRVSRFLSFNPELKKIYANKLDESSFFIPLIIEESAPFGLHKHLLKDPLEALKYYTLNTEMDFLCLNCKKYFKTLRLNDLPEKCPLCSHKSLIQLVRKEDQFLFQKRVDMHLSKEDKVKISYYKQLMQLFKQYGKFLYFIKAATNLHYRKCIKLLKGFSKEDFEFNRFFEKIQKVNKEVYNNDTYLKDDGNKEV